MARTSSSGRSVQEAWQRFEPGPTWNLKWAGHLLRRIGFGPSWPELQKVLVQGPQKAIDSLFQAPAEAEAFNSQMEQWERSATSLSALRAWWLRRMLETPQPLVEKMTLFWHSQLALGNVRNVSPPLVREYLATIRRHCLGRLDELLQAVVLQPAMLLSHGAEANRKARPSDHFARVLLEQFTVGPGRFTETDIHQTARALTGYFVLRDELRFINREYDSGPKTLFGQTGSFAAQELFQLLAKQPATAQSIVRKLYRFFISEAEEPADELLEPLSQRLMQGQTIGQIVETMLRSKWFFSPAAYRRRIKSPVEWALSVLRPMEVLVPTEPLSHALEELGQGLGSTPTPAGWPDGPYWISPALLLVRAKWAQQFWTSGSPFGQKMDPAGLAARHGAKTSTAHAEFILQLYLQDELAAELRNKLVGQVQSANRQNLPEALRQLCQTLALLPEFQLA
ncbi:MAG: DUF1800 domain-containing protein [Thermoguttaceae bacterium]|nr:DUF1800 domain-containing protein [Thermoguttaceae bacterium]MDW8037098.1 DUF1800 family protein [Thermoguttaceae bacterium]